MNIAFNYFVYLFNKFNDLLFNLFILDGKVTFGFVLLFIFASGLLASSLLNVPRFHIRGKKHE